MNRYFAFLTDYLIITILSASIGYLNIIHFKSAILYILTTLLLSFYKPLTEHKYSQTIGKKLFRLKVLKLTNQKIDLLSAFLRNIFFLLPSISLMPFYIQVFNSNEFAEVVSISEFGSLLTNMFPNYNSILNITYLLILIDYLYFLILKGKRSCALHDLISKTHVVKFNELKK
jgi:uncharacterized RDD family membrane protein YckC